VERPRLLALDANRLAGQGAHATDAIAPRRLKASLPIDPAR
jgi:hypothetical protein